MKKIITRDLENIKRYLTGGEKIITISFGIIISGFLFSNSVSATTMDTNVNIRPSMTLSVSSNDISLDLNPATKPFDTKDLTITIGTNNPTGYKLYLNSDSTNLVNTEDNTKTIETLPSSTPASGYDEASFPANYWGYRKSSGSSSSGNYLPFASDLLVSSSTGPSNETTTSIGLASKIDYLKESGTYTLDFKLNAVPLVTSYTMQELGTNSALAAEVCTESPTVVVDSRDNQTYTISKLKDGNCWMTQNLKLGKYTDSLTLTNADSNVGASGFVLANKRTNASLPSQNGGLWDNSAYYCSNIYGCFYNWYTATAGSGTSTTADNTTVNNSICPSGWTLPSGGDNGEYKKLSDAYDAVSSKILVADPLNVFENDGYSIPGFTLSGRCVPGDTEVNSTDMGFYWSSTSENQQGARYLALAVGHIYPAQTSGGNNVRATGRQVRCLLKEP